jgi:phosphate starvation-inducible PhoH-like protein
MYLTRLGHGSKMIITGDPEQVDIGIGGKYGSGLFEVIDKCRHRSSVAVIYFDNVDNVRHPSVEFMLEDL